MVQTKKTLPPVVNISVETRNISEIGKRTGNIYKAIAIMSKRANQIGSLEKEELHSKLAEFATSTDNLEEVHENREQIEISRFYEKKPKPSMVALQEYLENKLFARSPEADPSESEKD